MRLATVSIGLALLLLAAPSATAATTYQPSSLGVFTDQAGSSKTATLAPGGVIALHVMTDRVGEFDGELMSGVQFRVEVDPRLTILGKTIAPEAGIAFEPNPNEFQLGFGNCFVLGSTPRTLVTYLVQLPISSPDVADLRVRVTDLSNEPMAWIRCTGSTFEPLFPSGGALLNPSSPSIVHLSASPLVVVEGRTQFVSWESWGAASATLNGAGVPPTGTQLLAPAIGQELLLLVDDGPSATLAVQVIREPRIVDFHAEFVVPQQSVDPVRLSWRVEGADSIEIEGTHGAIGWIGDARVDLNPTLSWTLRATNEWGTTTQLATLRDPATSPPIILALTAHPNPFDLEAQITVNWSIWNADAATLLPFGLAVDPQSGSTLLQPTESTTITLEASNANGTVSHSLDLTLNRPRVLSFSADPQQLYPHESVTLQWEVTGAVDLAIEPQVGVLGGASGSIEVVPTQAAVEYVLTAQNAAGITTESRSVLWLPPIVELTADDTNPYGGEEILLDLQIEGATSASLLPGFPVLDPVDQQLPVTILEDTVFILEAVNDAGSSQVQVEIQARKPLVEFVSDVTELFSGQSVLLSAQIEGASSASILPFPGVIDPNGGAFSVVVDQSTDFILQASNPAGSTQSVLHVEALPPVVELSADDTQPYGGQQIQLDLRIAGATSASLLPGHPEIEPIDQIIAVTILEDTNFILSANSPAGSAEAQLQIQARPPTAVLSVSDNQPFPSETITVTATVTGATSATLLPSPGPIDAAGGSFEFIVSEPTLFQLFASNPVGESVAEVTVTPSAPIATGNTFVEPANLASGESATIRWNFAGADLVRIEPIGYETEFNASSLIVAPTTTTTYVVRAINAVGELVVELPVTVAPYVVDSFTATPALIVPGQESLLSWSVRGDASVELVDIGPQPQSGSLTVQPQQTTTYTLRAFDEQSEIRRSLQVHVSSDATNGLRVSAYPDGTGSTFYPNPFNFTPIYVVVPQVVIAMNGYEFSLAFPTCMFPQAHFYPESSVDVGPGSSNFIVGMGQCIYAGSPYVLMRLDVFTLDFCSGDIVVAPSTPSSFFPPIPGFASCAGDLLAFSPIENLRTGSIISVLQVELELRPQIDGLLASWRVPDAIGNVSRLVLERSEVGGVPRPLHEVPVSDRRSGRWLDTTVQPGTEYLYQAVATTASGEVRSEAVKSRLPEIASARSILLDNVPNPFNPSTRIRFRMGAAGDASLDIHDLSGRLVYQLRLTGLGAGEHEHEWHAVDGAGHAIASGVYVVRLRTDFGEDTRRVALLK